MEWEVSFETMGDTWLGIAIPSLALVVKAAVAAGTRIYCTRRARQRAKAVCLNLFVTDIVASKR